MKSSDQDPSPERPAKRSRKLRPGVAAELLARHRRERLDELYLKPVESLEPEELAQMKAAFFRS